MATLIVKIAFGTEIRRFTTNQSSLNWATLSKRVAELFEFGAQKKYKCTYVDDEGDKVTLSSDDELNEAVSLALATSPAVLRLSVEGKTTTPSTTTTDTATEADVEMSDAASTTDATPTADAGTDAKPTNADAGTHAKPTTADASTNESFALPPNLPAEMAPLFHSLARQLPELINNLPPGVRNLIPHAELDVAATMAANAAANASCAAAAAQQAAAAAAAANPTPPTTKGNNTTPSLASPPHAAGIHPGVTCDKSGMSPIVGPRYHLVGHNYDLCQAEYEKLSDKEKALYQLVPPPFAYPIPPAAEGAAGGAAGGAAAPNLSTGIHPGVECDKSGMCPIVGMRYHLRGHNYDVCQAEYDKLPATEKLLYTAIPPPPAMGEAAATANAFAPAAAAAAGNGTHWSEKAAWAGAWGGPQWGAGGGGGRWGHNWGPGRRCGGGGGANAGGEGGCGMGMGPKLAARFVRDVTIFDGTQMAPATKFTKIWRLKNIGEVPWPAGTRMLYVGGDQMTTEMSVPLNRAGPVLPGEEVDVAVEMVAPSELGRYLGYWRLVGPHGRRKFGQRVWCHVQVVDPNMEAVSATDADLESVLAEVAKKKLDLAAQDEDNDDGAAAGGATDGEVAEAAANVTPLAADALAADALAAVALAAVAEPPSVAEAMAVDVSDNAADAPTPTLPTLTAAADKEVAGVGCSSADSDDGLLTDTELAEAVAAAPSPKLAKVPAAMKPIDATPAEAAPKEVATVPATVPATTTTTNNNSTTATNGKAPIGSAATDVRTALASMGFNDASMLEVVIGKHGDDLEACARDLAAATEWDALLDDLSEMGFANRELNKTLMLKHNGNVKRTVKELVEDA